MLETRVKESGVSWRRYQRVLSRLFGQSFLGEETGWVPGCVHVDVICVCFYQHNPLKDRL